MVDLPSTARNGDGVKIKSFMERTPSLIKSKFLSVLGNSNDFINGLSNKLDISLSLTSSSETEINTPTEDMSDNARAQRRKNNKSFGDDDDSLDENIIDFESRKAKERRAHEEVLSGRYRQPNILSKLSKQESHNYDLLNLNRDLPLPREPRILQRQRKTDSDKTNSDGNKIYLDPESKISAHNLTGNTTPESNKMDRDNDGSSGSTSECEQHPGSKSAESSDMKMWIRSESENSFPSWASSISLDSKTEEATLDFMRQFVGVLFDNSAAITLELKSEFGQKATLEAGRLWFARLVSSQRSKSKRVDETTFYSLVQYFAIILFECAENEDYSPAKILMNMCFTYYHEVEVPGCEPYREYLYTYLREQTIWHTLRFWNAAFFDALQCERAHRPVLPSKQRRKTRHKKTKRDEASSSDDDQFEVSNIHELKEDQQFQQNISFGQLGTFTCNMHAFGLSRTLCVEFLKKQAVIANLNKDQEKMLRENINRMYRETDKWRT